MEGVEASLSKIRHHTNSQLENQKRPAQLLQALESTLDDQSAQRSPTTYFAALLSTASQASEQEQPDENIFAACLYLLSLVVRHCPAAVLKTKLDDLLLIIHPALSGFTDDPAVLRSALGILQPAFTMLGSQQLAQPRIVQTYMSVLPLVIHSSPKVRKRAQEFVQEVLTNPAPPMATHPFIPRTADWILETLEDVFTENKKRSKKSRKEGSSGGDPLATRATALCGVIRSLASEWPDEVLAAMLPIIVQLPRLSSPFVTSQSYTLLQTLFSTSPDSFAPQSILNTIEALLAAKPDERDHSVLPGWLSGLEAGIVSLSRKHPQQAEEIIKDKFDTTLDLLTSDASTIRFSASSFIQAVIRYGISNERVLEGATGIFGDIYQSIITALQTLRFRSSEATPYLLTIATSFVSRARLRKNGKPIARIMCTDLVKLAENLRNEEGVEYRDEASELLGMLVEVCGPPWILEILPLNLNESLQDKTGRAWLLPIISKKATNTTLKHFTTFFIPLSEQMFSRHEQAVNAGKYREIEAKIYETLVEQIWATLPGYCDLPVDMPEAFNQPFMEKLANMLYQRPTLRSPILRALQLLVQRNVSLAASSAPSDTMKMSFGLAQDEAKENVHLLKSQANNILLVLFNVFSAVGRERGATVLECVGAYLSILEPTDISATFSKIRQFLSDAISSYEDQNSGNKSNGDQSQHKEAHSMMDLVVVLIPYCDTKTAKEVFEMITDSKLIASKDQVLQKKTYRALTKLCTESTLGKTIVTQNIDKTMSSLEKTRKNVPLAAKRDRMLFLASFAPLLPPSTLHLISSIIPEAVLGTKESNEKTREAAYDLVVSIGHKMQAGGTVNRNLVAGMEDEDEEMGTTDASLDEYFNMVSAKLEDPSPHIVSATITALSRLLFEFHEMVSINVIYDLIIAVVDFLGSANREIVKSAIGFVKVSVVSLPKSTVSPYLQEIVPALVKWSGEHKNHFKVKIRHLFERMIRKFSFEDIEALVDEDNRKMITNVRKRQLRAKRQRDTREDAAADADGKDLEDTHKEHAPRENVKRNAYEEVLYGSDSELDSEDETAAKKPPQQQQNKRQSEVQQQRQQKSESNTKKKNKHREAAVIEEDEDGPLDLLEPSTMGRVLTSNTKNSQQNSEQKRTRELNRYNTDSKGRLVIDDSDQEDGGGVDGDRSSQQNQTGNRKRTREETDGMSIDDELMDVGDSTNAYLEALKGEDGFTRDNKGKVKFNKKRDVDEDALREEIAGEFSELNVDTSSRPKKKKKSQATKLGSEFKAKRAGGDVKKGNLQPYAYLPLNSMTKSKGSGKRQGKVDILGKNQQRSKSKR